MGTVGDVGVVGLVHDLGAAGGVTLRCCVLEGKGCVGPLFLDVGDVGSVLARGRALDQPMGLGRSLLAQVLAVLLAEGGRAVLVLHVACAPGPLVEAALRDSRELHEARIGRQALVLGEVVELRH